MRIYHHYIYWEEHHAGMWRHISGKRAEEYLQRAISFTGDAELYGSYMMKVIDQWPKSCEQNLTCPSMNRQAWIGHAACCIAIGCPEEITRLAWHHLTQKQQDDANVKADEAIAEWQNRNLFRIREDHAEKVSRQKCLFGSD